MHYCFGSKSRLVIYLGSPVILKLTFGNFLYFLSRHTHRSPHNVAELPPRRQPMAQGHLLPCILVLSLGTVFSLFTTAIVEFPLPFDTNHSFVWGGVAAGSAVLILSVYRLQGVLSKIGEGLPQPPYGLPGKDLNTQMALEC